MEPRIEYDNPLAPGRPDKIAGADKARREDRKQRPNKRRKPRKRHRDDTADSGSVDDTGRPSGGRLGKRVDFEA